MYKKACQMAVIGAFFVCFSEIGYAGEWVAHQTSLNGAEINIRNLQGEIKAVHKKQKETHDKEAQKALVEQVVRLYADLKTERKKFFTELEHVKYQHPERGQEIELKYKSTLVTMLLPETDRELSQSIDEMLKSVKAVMVSQYGDYSYKDTAKKKFKFDFQIEQEEQEAIESLRPVLSAGTPEL